jgi:large subunit ribosomal protein L13
MKSTTSISPQTVQRRWLLIDAQNAPLGRVSARIAELLMGKRKVYYVTHQDMGDYIVVINAGKVTLSGNKESEKIYYRHSGYPGGLKSQTARQVRESDPRKLVERTVKGMLPKTKLGREMFKKLHVFSDNTHKFDEAKLVRIEVK